MNFVYPTFLYALAAILVPIIIHLFHFRRFRTIYFSNVRFLKEVKEETASKSNLKHLLVLISRILAIAFLVFAFAQPFIPSKETNVTEGQKTVSIYIDNSFSMDALGDQVDLLEIAKAKALEIMYAYGEADAFQIITNDFEGKHQRLVDKELFSNYVSEVDISPDVRTLEQVKLRQLQALENSNNPIIYQISDFQMNITNLEEDSTVQLYMVPLKSVSSNNISIDSIWFTSPVQILSQSSNLIVSLTNHGTELIENAGISLLINNERKALGDFTLAPESSKLDTLGFTVTYPGWNECEVNITDFPLTFDDKYYFTFEAAESLNMLCINDESENTYINGLSSQPIFDLVNVNSNQVDYSSLDRYRLIILNQLNTVSSGLAGQLTQFVENGGNLVVFPDEKMDIENMDRFLSQLGAGYFGSPIEKEQNISYIETSKGLFYDVFSEIPKNLHLPTVKKYFPIPKRTVSTEIPLIQLQDGSSFLSKYTHGKGSVFLTAVPPELEFSDLPKHTLFVIMITQMAIIGEQSTQLSYTIGIDNAIEIQGHSNTNDGNFKIEGITNPGIDFFPPQSPLGNDMLIKFSKSGAGYDQLKEAGLYNLYLPGSGFNRSIAFNYDRTESETGQYSPSELKEKYPASNFDVIEQVESDLTSVIGNLNNGVPLWKLCIIFALVFLGIEILLLRFLPE